jgi:hypothetical protein
MINIIFPPYIFKEIFKNTLRKKKKKNLKFKSNL